MLQKGVSPDVGDYDVRTALHLASSSGKLDVIQVLIEELGANPSKADRWGGTPLDNGIPPLPPPWHPTPSTPMAPHPFYPMGPHPHPLAL